MKKTDLLFLKYNAVIIIIGSIMNNFSIKHLVAIGYSSSSVLVYRSLITFIFTILLSAGNNMKILPANIKRQALFMTNAGISLLLLFQSYTWLKAATVAMVQRLDIPAAVLIGFFTAKRARDFKVGLSFFAFLLVLSIFFFSSSICGQPAGLAMALVAVIMTSYSYLLIKRSTGEENNFVIVNTVNIGCILVGLISGFSAGNLAMIKLTDTWVFGLASLSQFVLNYSMAVLYKHHDVERGRRPYLVAALIVLLAEQLLTATPLDAYSVAVNLAVIAVIYLITLKELPTFLRKDKKQQSTSEDELTEFN